MRDPGDRLAEVLDADGDDAAADSAVAGYAPRTRAASASAAGYFLAAS